MNQYLSWTNMWEENYLPSEQKKKEKQIVNYLRMKMKMKIREKRGKINKNEKNEEFASFNWNI